MNRTRTAFAIVALAAFVFLSLAPAAQALPMRGKPAISEAGGSWLDAAMVWLGSLLTGREDATRATEKAKPSDVDYKPIVIEPQYTGACIDPNGCTWGG